MPQVYVLPVLLICNLVVFALMLLRGIHPMEPAIDSLIAWGANYGPRTTGGEWWRLGSAMFVHIGVPHLLFNMIALWSVGGFMERMLGSVGFLALYLLAGLTGSLASVAWSPLVVSAGASGAIFGLYGGLVGVLLRRRALMPGMLRASLQANALVFLGYNLLDSFGREGIDMAAHLGGLGGGCVCGLVLIHPFVNVPWYRRWLRTGLVSLGGAIVCVGLTFAVPRVEDFETVLRQFLTLEQARTRLQAGRHTDRAFARLLEQDVLPQWRAQRQAMMRFEQTQRLPEPQRRLVAALIRYMTVRQEGLERLHEGVQKNDQRVIRLAYEKQREADRLLEQLGAPGK